ncbi:hypothetical protein DM01DRAFT_1399490 [Hesseltinella vesiculosa]|uniref:Uncharacterized protein n=1 Tax=Hesseltinella vesiculosa TaxID=101127 RepID=A0A1X2G3L1_9FUNG|nr:hypothetical protein DM01DRAFT_1399490 [Hesseltinella vesiculosa]
MTSSYTSWQRGRNEVVRVQPACSTEAELRQLSYLICSWISQNDALSEWDGKNGPDAFTLDILDILLMLVILTFYLRALCYGKKKLGVPVLRYDVGTLLPQFVKKLYGIGTSLQGQAWTWVTITSQIITALCTIIIVLLWAKTLSLPQVSDMAVEIQQVGESCQSEDVSSLA